MTADAIVRQALRDALAAADAVVLSGGVSVGAYDFVPAAVTAVGARTLVHGVAMKPGKPFLFAHGAQGPADLWLAWQSPERGHRAS
jgi:molybdopterin molybdotransferase